MSLPFAHFLAISHYGSQDQLKRFLQILVDIKLYMAPFTIDGIQAGGLLVQILRSAEFWELPNIRCKCFSNLMNLSIKHFFQAVFLDLLDVSTSSLHSSEGKVSKTAKVVEKVAVYRLLLFFPLEYLSWQLLNDLIKRALDADLILSDSPSASRKETVGQAIVTLRIFLKRAYIYSGSVAQESVRVILCCPSHVSHSLIGCRTMNFRSS